MLVLLVVLFFVHLRFRVSSIWLLLGTQQVVSEHPRFFVGFSGDSESIGC